MVGAVLLTRVWWLDHGLWSLDEGATFTMAQQVLEGDVLYRDAADHRSPLMPYLKASIFAIFGDWNAPAVHTILALLLGLCAAGVGWIGRKLDRPATGWVGALFFVFLQILLVDANDAMSANTAWFVVIFSTLAFVLLVRSTDKPNFKGGIPIGFFFALSILCKQPGLLDTLAAVIIVGLLIISHGKERIPLLKLLGGMVTGVALPLTLTVVYFAFHGALEDYIYYAFTFNTVLYIPEVPLVERLAAMRIPFVLAWNHTPIVGILGLGAAFVGTWSVLRDLIGNLRIRENLLIWIFLGWTAAEVVTTGPKRS